MGKQRKTWSAFDNPTGITMSLPRRKLLIELAARYGVPILEDNPYGEYEWNLTAKEPDYGSDNRKS